MRGGGLWAQNASGRPGAVSATRFCSSAVDIQAASWHPVRSGDIRKAQLPQTYVNCFTLPCVFPAHPSIRIHIRKPYAELAVPSRRRVRFLVLAGCLPCLPCFTLTPLVRP